MQSVSRGNRTGKYVSLYPVLIAVIGICFSGYPAMGTIANSGYLLYE